MLSQKSPTPRNAKGFTSIAIKGFAWTGTIFRSSRLSASRIARLVAPSARIIVEYGAGDGVISKAILKTMHPDARLYGIEILEDFFATLLKVPDSRFIAVHGSVVELSERLIELTGSSPDTIVSGIPFSFLSPSERDRIVANTFSALAPGGKFIVYQVTPSLAKTLRRYFQDVKVELELWNLPPYFIMTGTKSAESSPSGSIAH
jgi:phospholipid N-methyltransferase